MNPEDLLFDGQVAVVTGAARGIGREHALLLARRGARVVVNDHGVDADGMNASSEPAEEVAHAITEEGGVAISNADSVASEQGAARIIGTAIEAFGRIDIVINNAGLVVQRSFLDASSEEIAKLFNVNALGTLLVSRAAWPHLVESGYGRVVNTTSGASFGVEGLCDYSATKGAILAFTNSLALEGAPHGIRVNGLAPAAATRMVFDVAARYWPPEQIDLMKPLHPRFVAPVAAYLSHARCSLSGKTLTVAAGAVGMMGLASEPLFQSDTEPTPESVASALERAAAEAAFQDSPSLPS